jgi:hypothetical protein
VFQLTKYEKWYWSLIEKFQIRGWTKKSAIDYVEGHHPYPIGLFGKSDNSWRVWVTPREHYVLHLLLTKFTPLGMPMFWSQYTSREFSPARVLKSKSMLGEKHHLYGVGHTQEMKDKMKLDPRVRSVEGKVSITDGLTQRFIFPGELIPEGWVLGGVRESEATREKKRKVDPAKRAVNKGRKFSQEWKDNLKKAQANRPLMVCPECGKICKGQSALTGHRKKHDPSKLLKMSLIAQLREANKKEKE